MVDNRMNPDDRHCGPVAIASVLGIDASDVMKRWPTKWEDPTVDRKFFLWPIDTPWLHRVFLEDSGRRFLPCGKDGPFPRNSIALLHNNQWGRNPLSRLLGALLFQHWVVVLEDNGDTVVVDWGTKDNPVREFPRERFLKMINSGWPYSVYTIA